MEPEQTKQNTQSEITQLTDQVQNLNIEDPNPQVNPPQQQKHQQQKQQPRPQQFTEKTVEQLAEKLKNGVFSNIAIMAGAGISVSAGIPDFRSPGIGLYSRLQEYGLAYPQQIFDISFFRKNPEPFYVLCKQLMGDYKPTPTHSFIKLLQEKGLLLMCYSQNIDGLQIDAGLSAEKLVQAHGHYRNARCVKCKEEVPIQDFRQKVNQGVPLYCQKCNKPIKPDVTFFGQALPDEFRKGVVLLGHADLLIIVGTSLQVMPFANLAFMVDKKVPRVILNKTKLDSATASGFKTGVDQGTRDVCLFNTQTRARDWPILLQIQPGSFQILPQSPSKCKDFQIIKRDIDRSLFSLDIHQSLSDQQRKIKRSQLSQIVNTVIFQDQSLSYFQGFHSLCSIFYQIGDLDLGFKMSLKASQTYLKDSMSTSFEKGVMAQLFLIYEILEQTDRILAQKLKSFYIFDGEVTCPIICLS